MTSTIRILGIDPGLRHTGWGVIELTGMRLTHIAHGVISIDPKLEMSERLGGIFEAVGELARYHEPMAAGVEETLVNANPRAALKLGQARGAAMAALAMAGLPVAEFAPRKIKLAVVGTGTADKEQVMFMVKRLLPKVTDLKSDSADALACAICAAHHLPTEMKRGAA
ncbi:MAG: crossover junction endodeoxyribonuclease RuvC [Hyphomonas sp.]|uniref:crossover junction endodeoxyribonuclease RuvC n=1 Tax=Hyphomonas sp. TaxID=87 RepID=UPI00352711C7